MTRCRTSPRILRRRDIHGRGLRGPLFPENAPAGKTRPEVFDAFLSWELAKFSRHLGKRLEKYDFAVTDVPQNDPAPWEDGIPLGRFLPFERPAKIHGRILFYRIPIIRAAREEPSFTDFLHSIVAGQIASALGETAAAVDYRIQSARQSGKKR
ncbi:metallopeptidase family protein [Arcanobacterium sp. S3PF19]|uniref:metallopeptidase family protein n=1 Tax=Arcanobacterium sp. S3PF19 TaxID=1219585 RepID=UPI00068B168C|nr:metallopeptidase family protein [Arcanobacterium sp. S3PF19]